MTREASLAAIRAACIEANPEINFVVCHCGEEVASSKHGYHSCGAFLGGLEVFKRPIRLADVLLAIPKLYITRGEDGIACIKIRDAAYRPNDGGAIYNLPQDDLTLQSDECIEFLASLLSKKI